MTNYRWNFWRFLPLFLMITGGGFVLQSLGLFGRTVVERKVFENSYQRSAALEAQIATDEATIAEIERKLANPNLDADTKNALEAQAAAARIRIAAAQRGQ